MKFIPDKITQFVLDHCISYIQWLASSANKWLPLSRLSLIMLFLWICIFMVWFLSKSLQSSESSLTLFFKRFQFVTISSSVVISTSIAVASYFIATSYQFNDKAITWLIELIAKPLFVTIVLICFTHLILGWFSLRHWIPSVNRWINEKATKKSYHDSGIIDVRDISKLIPKQKNYSPEKYWDKTQKSFFIGLEPDNKPVYVPLNEWKTQHQQVLGTTGYGKGVAVSNQLAQCLAFGQTVVAFDPKNDEWAPSVLINIAEKYKRPFCIIDLNNDSPQFNPLYGANEMEIYDLFIGGFGLAERGAESDYYRSKERRVVQQWLNALKQGTSLSELVESLTEVDFDNAPKLCNDLAELAMLGCIHTCLLYTSPSPRDQRGSRMPSSA